MLVLKLDITKESLDFIRTLEPKQFKQVMNKVLSLLVDPTPADSSVLKGYENLRRADIGEHRIVYSVNKEALAVLIVDKRNDDEVYKKLSRKNL